MREHLPPYPATFSQPVRFFLNGFRSRTPRHADVFALTRRVRQEQESIWAADSAGLYTPSAGECAVTSRLVNSTLAKELGCRAAIGLGQVVFDDPELTAISSHWWSWVPTSDRGLVIADLTLDQSGHNAPYVCETPDTLAAQGIHYGPSAPMGEHLAALAISDDLLQ